ncbi:MAG: RluA family pseudouridine synthase [Planctomycetes bacterium]|nr:RluA family pseudouridine synthase [Planctomycetota bacterium]
MAERFVVDAPGRLLEFLRRSLPGWKRSTLEQRIRAGSVRVNGATWRRNDFVTVGDQVSVGDRDDVEIEREAPAGIELLHLDDDLVAIDKPAGLLSVSTEREKQATALALVRDHLARAKSPARLWPAHRIDRETSGVLLFARSAEVQESVQAAWERARKTYLALVEGRPTPPAGVIDQPLWEDRGLFVRVGRHPEAKAARTRYATRETRGASTLVEVQLETGRRHQIRAHLAWLGHPIVGDPRYGTAGARMGLHAWKLELDHPADGRRLELVAPPPKGFGAR